MFTLIDYDNMMVDTVIDQGTAINGTGGQNDSNPVMGDLPRGAAFTWVAKRKVGGWSININGSPQNVRNMAMIRKLVPCTEDVLTYYSYN